MVTNTVMIADIHNIIITDINRTFLLFFIDALTFVPSQIQIDVFKKIKEINTEPIKGSVNKIVLQTNGKKLFDIIFFNFIFFQ